MTAIPFKRAAQILTYLFIFLCLSLPASVNAGASKWLDYQQGKLRLVAASDPLDRNELLLGLQFDLQPGWKIFWRSPGDAGYPLSIDWSNSQNFTYLQTMWPRPYRFEVLGLTTYGYKNEVVVPLQAEIPNPAEPTAILAKVDFLTCSTVCIPKTVTVNLDFVMASIDVDQANSWASRIKSYKALVPSTVSNPEFGISTATLVPTIDGYEIQVVATSAQGFLKPDIFLEGPKGHVFSPPAVKLIDSNTVALLKVPVSLSTGQLKDIRALVDASVTFTLIDNNQSVETKRLLPLGRSKINQFRSLFSVLLLALIGGLILNIMPCVLPVLSIKLLTITSSLSGSKSKFRSNFLSTAAGIIAAFFLIALFVTILDSVGAAIGWGIHFQEPLFIAVMIGVMTIFTANLLGWFEFRLPQWVIKITMLGGKGQDRQDLVGSFFAGIFATILATPCSAPFLGTAIGFALTRGPIEVFSIFIVLGLGMSLPFLLVAVYPGLVIWLPRPGQWMHWVKKVFAGLLLLTIAWLLLVFNGQTGVIPAGILIILMSLLMGLLWLRKYIDRLYGFLLNIGTVSLLFVALGLAGTAERTARPTLAENTIWQPFDETEIVRLIDSGNIVFVDVTADWCVTCKINKVRVLNRSPAFDLLSRPDVVAMRADWTNKNNSIAAYLAGFQRFGIPFNVVYSRLVPDGLVLPELLDSRSVTSAVEIARGHLAQN